MLVLPLASGKKLLLPAEPALFRRALSMWPSVRLPARAYRAALATVSAIGLHAHVLPSGNEIFVGLGRMLDRLRYVAQKRLEIERPKFALLLGASGPEQTHVAQIFSELGELVAFAKIANSATSRVLVAREFRVLKFFNGLELQSTLVPAPLGFSVSKDYTILLTKPIEIGRRSQRLKEAHFRSVAELVIQTLGTCQATNLVQQTVSAASDPALLLTLSRTQLGVVQDALEEVGQALGNMQIPTAWCFGDFVPWNVGHSAGSARLAVVDLEYGESGTPAGWDLIRFIVEGRRSILNSPLGGMAVVTTALRRAFPDLEVGRNRALVRWLFAFYHARTIVTYASRWASSGLLPGSRTRDAFSRRVFVLQRILAELEGTSARTRPRRRA